ncbi:ornithine carbamoyltransferase [Helicobacter cinaedi]|uniref:ornithine carbamoyltransferase n=1 Tax=Helicobacter TaxID=209 RepID=UPI000CF138EF|nr:MULTISPECIES: ornithine carbamoyltransferase [Helicobacter]AWK61013.1 ornithine carbamoyltransferase [Helicobacter cinaedi]QOQ96594.1 ornithine carbamoyltransferase [Helicobacter cinaedi]
MRHFLTLNDFSKDEILAVTNLALKLKQELRNSNHTPYLKGKILAMIFEKSSTRTRVSFEGGIYQLGGHGMFLSHKDIQLGRGEPIKDTSRVISSMVDMVMMRTDRHEKLQEFAEYSSVPIINGLSDDFHPVQLMADYLTMLECGIALPDGIHKNGLKKPIVAYIGDGNNMAHSWINLAAILGFELRVASPLGYFPRADITESALKTCKQSGGAIHIMQEPQKAVSGVNVVVTDTWASMGQEEQKKEREKAFVGFCVDDSLMNLAQEDAIFLHCLPAYRGQEVSESVLEGKQSRVFQEANNRLHAQKAIMLALVKLNNLPLAYPLEMEL